MVSRWSSYFRRQAESGLPSGDTAGRGLTLDPSLVGVSTYAKPEEDTRNPDNRDESMFRVRHPDDLTKDQSQGQVDTNYDNAEQDPPSYMGLGPSYKSPKTKYPYRDDRQNAHNASFIAGLWGLKTARILVGATAEKILSGLDKKFSQQAKKCKVVLKRADVPNLRWIFSVTGNSTYVVKVKAIRKPNVVKLSKMDLELSCSCPAWKWLGPEFHSVSEGYQLGKPVGTASTPNVKDPERDNRVCKHVAAVLNQVGSWTIPARKK